MMQQWFVIALVLDEMVILLPQYVIMFNLLFVGALALWGPNLNFRPVFINDVHNDCAYHKGVTVPLDCHRSRRYCHYGGGASVRCREEQLRVQNVNVTTVNAAAKTVMISWEMSNNLSHTPSSFRIDCYHQQRARKEFSLSVFNGTLTQISLGGLTFSTCCVLARYYYDTERRCSAPMDEVPMEAFTSLASTQVLRFDSFTTPASIITGSSDEIAGSNINMQTNVIGGVLGSIIIILLLLLVLCGGILLFLLQSRYRIHTS